MVLGKDALSPFEWLKSVIGEENVRKPISEMDIEISDLLNYHCFLISITKSNYFSE